jgi:oxygen-independent coproporphyrinogen III oxidase
MTSEHPKTPTFDAESLSNIIPYSLYIHVPFCRQACSYCDFYFVTRQQLIPGYTDALLGELKQNGPEFIRQLTADAPGFASRGPTDNDAAIAQTANETTNPTVWPAHNETPGFAKQPNKPWVQTQLVSIYFGGGTPSRLPVASIARIMETINRVHGLSHVKEVTLEANPDDVTSLNYLLELKSAGITRLSMGVQSFNPELLKFMHRAHTADEARRSLELIREAEFNTFTADLIYGNPGQSLEMLDEDITELLRFNPPHVSAYALTIEPNTRLGRYASLGRINEPDDTQVSAHMHRVTERLAQHGLQRYEVSNFAQPGHEAMHNSSYWDHVPYLGAGPGAHSLLINQELNVDGSTVLSAVRWENEPDLKQYIDAAGAVPRFNEESLGAVSLAEERLLMGMRTRKGVHVAELANRYGYKLSDAQQQLIVRLRAEGRMKPGVALQLTPEGLALADRITLDLISR